jgi:hypothetical protein
VFAAIKTIKEDEDQFKTGFMIKCFGAQVYFNVPWKNILILWQHMNFYFLSITINNNLILPKLSTIPYPARDHISSQFKT